MSMDFPFRDARYMTPPNGPGSRSARPSRVPRGRGRGPAPKGDGLLRVVLDDELFLDLGVDLRPPRKLVDEDLHLVGHDLKPRRDAALAGLGARDDHRGELKGLPRDLDDVVLGDPVRRDVDALAVDQEVAVADKLAGHVAALGEAGPVDDVVEAALQDLQEGLAGPAGAPGGLLVVTLELLLEHAVDAPRLLLLPDLDQVLAVLLPVAAVLARRVRPDLDRALRRVALGALEEQLDLLAAAKLAIRPCVTSHKSLSCRLRPDAASAGGSHCAEPGSRPGSGPPRGPWPAASGSRFPGRSPGP